MNTQNWYLQMLLRLDRIQALINAITRFRASRCDRESYVHLDRIRRLQKSCPETQPACSCQEK